MPFIARNIDTIDMIINHSNKPVGGAPEDCSVRRHFLGVFSSLRFCNRRSLTYQG